MTRLTSPLPLGAAYGRQNPFALPPRRNRGPQVIDEDPLSQEEERSLLGKTMGAVQYLGETLDKPNAAVRGLLAGRPDQLLNLVPFSDTMELTDPAERTRGRELLEMAGIAAPNKPGLFNSPGDFAGDVGGFALEVALDPLLWVSGPLGAVSKASIKLAKAARLAGTGKGVKAAGKGFDLLTDAANTAGRAITPSTWAEKVASGERAFASIQAPGFLSKYITGQKMIGTGPTAGKVADLLTSALARNPASRAARGLFTEHMRSATRAATQIIRDRAHAERQFLQNGVRDVVTEFKPAQAELVEQMSNIAKHHEAAGDLDTVTAMSQSLREWTEQVGGSSIDAKLAALSRNFGVSQDTVESIVKRDTLASQADDLLDTMAGLETRNYEDNIRLGMRVMEGEAKGKDIGKLSDIFIRYAPRRANDRLRKIFSSTKKDSKQAAKDYFDFGIARDDTWRHVAGGTASVNRMAMSRLNNGTLGEGIKTLSEAATRGTIQKGAIVQEVAGSGRFGKVLNVDEKGLAEVFTRDLETGLSKIESFRPNDLAVRRYGASDELLDGIHYRKASVEAKKKDLAEFLELKDGPGKASFESLHEASMLKQLRQQVEESSWETADDMMARLGIDDLTKSQWDNEILRTVKGKKVTKEQFMEEWLPEQAKAMSKFFRTYGTEVAHGGLFDNRIVKDHTSYMMGLMEHKATLRSVHKYLGDVTKGKVNGIRPAVDAMTDRGTMGLTKVWKEAGFGREGLRTYAKKHFPAETQLDPGQLVGLNKTQADELLGKKLDKFVGSLRIDEKAAAPLKAYSDIAKQPVQNDILDMLDRATAAYKGMLTVSGGPVWGTAFHTRNLGSGLWQSWTDGKVSIKELLSGYKAAYQMARGKSKMQYIDEFIENGGLDAHGHMVQIAGEEATKTLSRHIPKGPLGDTLGVLSYGNVKKAFRERGGHAANPLHSRGVANTPKSLLGESGENAYKYVEFLNRGGYYEALRKKGFSVGESMDAVTRSQFDYTALSTFEKSFMRRTVPFYAWSRKNVPYQFAKLLESPGGRAAQTARLFGQGDKDQYTPGYMREGLSVPVSGDERDAGFLRQSGLPIEDLNKFVMSGGMPASRTLQKFGGLLHPGIAAPIEMFAGKKLYSGQSIDSVRSVTGQLSEAATGTPRPMRLADKAIDYSPFSRAMHEAAGMLGSKPVWQKVLNQTTGAKFSQVDLLKQKLNDMSKAIKDELKNSDSVREGTYHYIPEELKDQALEEQEAIQRLGALAKTRKQLQEQKDREDQMRAGSSNGPLSAFFQ